MLIGILRFRNKGTARHARRPQVAQQRLRFLNIAGAGYQSKIVSTRMVTQ